MLTVVKMLLLRRRPLLAVQLMSALSTLPPSSYQTFGSTTHGRGFNISRPSSS